MIKKIIAKGLRLLFRIIHRDTLLKMNALINAELGVRRIFDILFLEYGHSLSKIQNASVDKNGSPIPWYTYPAIEFLEQLDLTEKVVFEWGCGNSSLYLASKCKFVYSVEHDKEWFDKINRHKKENQVIRLLNKEEYVKHIEEVQHKFDVIVIDGEERNACSHIALDFLNEGGMIILDNSDWYKNSAKVLREGGLVQIDMHGFGPINDYTWTTSFFLSRNVNFNSAYDTQPIDPIGGTKNAFD